MKNRREIILAGAPLAAATAVPALAEGTSARDVAAARRELIDLMRLAGAGADTPEIHGAAGDGEADDTEAIAAWLRGPGAPKVAPPGRTYRLGRPIDLTEAGGFDADFSGSVLKLAHRDPADGDTIAVYGLLFPARHALRNLVIEGLGRKAMQSGILTAAAADGGITWENVWFRHLQRRAFHVRADNFIGMGFIRITDCQTFPGPLPEGYDEGAGRFNCRNFTIAKLWGEGGSKRCFAFGDPTFDAARDATESGYVGHVYVPNWETLGYSGQALYCNFANSVTFARVDVLDYHCDVSSAAVYFSRDCRDIAVLSAHVSARGHPLTTALNIGGGKRIQVRNAYLRSQGRVLRIEGHRHNHFTDDITVEGTFRCDIPEGVRLVEPPILLRNNTLGRGESRDLRGATIRGKLILTGKGSIVPPGDRSEHSARGCFLMVDSCTGTVLLDGIEMDARGRDDVIPVGVGSTGSVAQVILRDMRIRTGGRPCLAAWKGDVRVQGGSCAADAPEGEAGGSVILAPEGTDAAIRVLNLDAGRGRILLAHGAGHAVVGCIAEAVAVPETGFAGNNLAVG